ncbi:aminotransferase class III-fold pyridoxal phosphate-dependent enzyme [Streptomyces tendae]|uniref:aminotransferase class III-fold pyridoxal phosphate-dependent enzyme n=1 Tax=Streptomyces tendae TaxID=1932 RepID=UPI00342262EC
MAETAYEGLAGAWSADGQSEDGRSDGGFEDGRSDGGFEDGRSEDAAGVSAGAGGAPRRQPAREAAARTYARALPVVPVRARGLTIEDAAGRRYLDCASGAGTLALGHHHPIVLEAMRRVLDSETPLQVMGLTTPVEDAFVTELLRTLPPRLADHARVRFCRPGGTDPVDTAVALVRAATGRASIVTPTGAHLCAAAEACCPSDAGEPPAGVVLEPVRSADGVLPVPDAWLRDLRRVTAERSVPLIADETETGVGRTGALWAVDHSGVTPDVLILSKAIGGSLPLAAVVHHEDLDGRRTGSDRRAVGAPGAGTFRGNQLALAAGAATLAHVREQRLAEHAAALGGRILSRLRGLAAEFACVGNVRGRGLMIGVELVSPDGAPDGAPSGGTRSDGIPSDSAPSDGNPSGGIPSVGGPPGTGSELALAVQRECLRRGLIVALTGPDRNVVRLLPPLIITDEQTSTILDRFADAVQTVDRRRGGHAPPRRAHAAR